MMLLRWLAAIPTSFHGVVVTTLWWMSYPFTRRERAQILTNIEHVYQLAPHSHFAQTFVRQVLENQCRVYLETLSYVFFSHRVRILGLEECRSVFEAAQKEGRGLVVITSHLGSWELAGHFVALSLKRPFHVLAKPSRTRWINPVLDQLRRMLRMSVFWTDSKSLYRDMLTALDRGESLGFVMDQRPGTRTAGHPVTFLGIPDTLIVSGPAKMIAKKNVGVVSIYCVRQSSGQFRLLTTKILDDSHGIADEAAISQLLAADMEEKIKLYSEQWSWNYKRWSRAIGAQRHS